MCTMYILKDFKLNDIKHNLTLSLGRKIKYLSYFIILQNNRFNSMCLKKKIFLIKYTVLTRFLKVIGVQNQLPITFGTD